MVDIIIKLIQQVGFPIAVTVYLLIVYDKRLREIKSCLTKILVALEGLKNAVGEE